eukprot:TRINITY_DN85472_c0_g1_i1.p1 TRINITY_DN85472_c0_g1~~TRINITY_DN85472_c0_g1_i1.p1  ORF type:complete len:305 (+),score=6.07 TRINITY_DN85472_c0_g1_i1:26-940(+)
MAGQGPFLIVSGGRNRGMTLSVIEYLCIANDQDAEAKWVHNADYYMKTARGSHGLVNLNGTIMAIGGGGIDSNLGSCEVWTPGAKSWQFLPKPMPTERHAQATVACTDGNTVFCLGGQGYNTAGKYECIATVERYDNTDQSWTTCAPMDTPRRLFGAVNIGCYVFVFGGAVNPNPKEKVWYTPSVERYNMNTNTWEYTRSIPWAACTRAEVCGGTAYVFVEGKNVLQYSADDDQYTDMGPLPLKEWFGFTTAVHGDTIYVIGGTTVGRWHGRVMAYCTTNNTWTEKPTMETVRRRCAACISPEI